MHWGPAGSRAYAEAGRRGVLATLRANGRFRSRRQPHHGTGGGTD